jgi:hypothetical protein
MAEVACRTPAVGNEPVVNREKDKDKKYMVRRKQLTTR